MGSLLHHLVLHSPCTFVHLPVPKKLEILGPIFVALFCICGLAFLHKMLKLAKESNYSLTTCCWLATYIFKYIDWSRWFVIQRFLPFSSPGFMFMQGTQKRKAKRRTSCKNQKKSKKISPFRGRKLAFLTRMQIVRSNRNGRSRISITC
jgi:hypothetical protein